MLIVPNQNEVTEYIPQQPYDQGKMYTAMRHRLMRYNLPASAFAVMVGLHTVCDANTGAFFRPDIYNMTERLHLPKQTVSYAMRRLIDAGLVVYKGKTEVLRNPEDESEGTIDLDCFVIAHFEQDRLDALEQGKTHGYFRLNAPLLDQLAEMVSSHNPRIILFALQLLDQSRVHEREMFYGMRRSLIRKWRLGSCPSRVDKALSLLAGIVLWTRSPNATGDDENLSFYLVSEKTYSEEQDKYRQLHGQVSRETQKAYHFARSGHRFSINLSWRELSRTTRLLIRYAIENRVDNKTLLRMAGLWGSTMAQNHVDKRKRLAYLRQALKNGGLYRDSLLLVS